MKWTKAHINIILKYCVKDQSLIRHMQAYKLYICEIHFTRYQIYIYATHKMLRESALLTLNLLRESASQQCNKTSSSKQVNARDKREEYQLFQDQMSQPVRNAYKSFEYFTSQIKSLTLTKTWQVEEVKEKLQFD